MVFFKTSAYVVAQQGAQHRSLRSLGRRKAPPVSKALYFIMSRIRILVVLAVSAVPAYSFAAGVDVVIIIPLYAVMFVLSAFSYGNIDTPTKSVAFVLISGLVMLLNWAFSFHIYIKWLANAIDSLEIALIFAAISPFLIVHFTNLLTRRIK